MIDDMYNVMLRINEIKSRFGLNKTVNQTAEKTKASSFDDLTGDAMNLLNGGYGIYDNENLSKNEIDRIADFYSKKKGVPSPLVRSVIKAESDYNIDAVSSKGAMGLMQLMPDTAEGLGVKNPFNPEENIKGGVTLLKSLIDSYNGDYKLALAAYNAGKRNVDRAGGIPDFKETKEYVKKVIDLYNKESKAKR